MDYAILSNHMTRPKVLAPVRDEISFVSAIKAGADAVYFSVGELNMRVNSKGIDMEALPRIVSLAHEKDVQVFITLNVIVYNQELERVREILQTIKDAKADAVICWDFAVIKLCKQMEIPFHISTQASISNYSSAQFYENLGAKCVVLARECTLEQITKIKRQMKKAKVEIFVHGAMCVSVSGRCFMSNFLECKSANRGACFQPCRREYTIRDKELGHELDVSNGYVMSPKDLCTLEILEDVIETGVDYLKIEGRGRSPEYIQTVVKAYRKAVDAIDAGTYTDALKEELMEEVKKVYNRGFSTGFLFGRPAQDAWSRKGYSQATEKKEFVGKVNNYYRKSGIAELIVTKEISPGDLLQFQGPTTGVERMTVQEFKVHPGKEVTFKTNFVVRESDEVYRVLKNTQTK